MKALKTCLLAILVLFSFASGLFGQGGYQHYFNGTYEWYETQYGSTPGDTINCMVEYFNHDEFYHIDGTDSVDGFHWYTVHHDRQETTECGVITTSPTTGSAGPAFRIREDSTGKIWHRLNNATIQMAYDFRPGIGIGDTLWMRDYTVHIVVASIDSLNFGMGKRARYWGACSSSSNPVYVVEGIGTMRSFSPSPFLCFPTADAHNGIGCASIDGSTLILDSSLACGSPVHVVVGLEDEIETGIGFAWYPVSERVVLTDLPSLETQGWVVYDINGRILYTGSHLKEEIPLPGLTPGMYVFVARGNGEQAAQAWRFLR